MGATISSLFHFHSYIAGNVALQYPAFARESGLYRLPIDVYATGTRGGGEVQCGGDVIRQGERECKVLPIVPVDQQRAVGCGHFSPGERQIGGDRSNTRDRPAR